MSTTVTVIASFIIALLSGLGVGSGGLLVIWLTMVEGLSQTDARSLNLLFFLFSAGSALLIHLKRRELKIPLVLMLSGGGILGTLLGTYLGVVTDPTLVRKIFGGMLVLSGIYTFLSNFIRRGRSRTQEKDSLAEKKLLSNDRRTVK